MMDRRSFFFPSGELFAAAECSHLAVKLWDRTRLVEDHRQREHQGEALE
jgi:hypothetical protein